MNQFVESLCRLYKANKIDMKKLGELLALNKITQQEYNYVISAKNEQ
jgi:hypothetical protein